MFPSHLAKGTLSLPLYLSHRQTGTHVSLSHNFTSTFLFLTLPSGDEALVSGTEEEEEEEAEGGSQGGGVFKGPCMPINKSLRGPILHENPSGHDQPLYVPSTPLPMSLAHRLLKISPIGNLQPRSQLPGIPCHV